MEADVTVTAIMTPEIRASGRRNDGQNRGSQQGGPRRDGQNGGGRFRDGNNDSRNQGQDDAETTVRTAQVSQGRPGRDGQRW